MLTFDELVKIKFLLDRSKIWNGQGWTQHPVHPYLYNQVLTLINREIEEQIKTKETEVCSST